MSRLKILYLRSSGGMYGAEAVILNLAKELNALVVIITSHA